MGAGSCCNAATGAPGAPVAAAKDEAKHGAEQGAHNNQPAVRSTSQKTV